MFGLKDRFSYEGLVEYLASDLDGQVETAPIVEPPLESFTNSFITDGRAIIVSREAKRRFRRGSHFTAPTALYAMHLELYRTEGNVMVVVPQEFKHIDLNWSYRKRVPVVLRKPLEQVMNFLEKRTDCEPLELRGRTVYYLPLQ